MALPDIYVTSGHWFDDDQAHEKARRPFDTTAEAAEIMIERHNQLVRPNDVVWILGSLGEFDYAGRLNGRKRLIAGFSDFLFAGRCRDLQTRSAWAARYRDEGGFEYVIDGAAFPRARAPIFLPIGPLRRPVALWSHPALSPDNAKRPGTEYHPAPPRRGREPLWLLHGEPYPMWSPDGDRDQLIRGRQISVSVDDWDFEPVPAEVLAGLMMED